MTELRLDIMNYINTNNLDERSEFVNNIIKLLLNSKGEINKDNIDKSLIEWDNNFNEYIHEFIRNVYELIDNEIPFMMLYDLKEGDWDNFDFETKEEYELAIEYCYDICMIFYKK